MSRFLLTYSYYDCRAEQLLIDYCSFVSPKEIDGNYKKITAYAIEKVLPEVIKLVDSCLLSTEQLKDFSFVSVRRLVDFDVL